VFICLGMLRAALSLLDGRLPIFHLRRWPACQRLSCEFTFALLQARKHRSQEVLLVFVVLVVVSSDSVTVVAVVMALIVVIPMVLLLVVVNFSVLGDNVVSIVVARVLGLLLAVVLTSAWRLEVILASPLVMALKLVVAIVRPALLELLAVLVLATVRVVLLELMEVL